MRYLQLIKYPLFQSLLLSLLLLNNWLVNNPNLIIADYSEWLLPIPPIWFTLALLNIVFGLFTIFKKIQINNSLLLFLAVFTIFQLNNLSYIKSEYIWNTIPDSKTYKLIGETLFECGKLAISCVMPSELQWPIGQPIISRFLATFFYSYSHYIYLILLLSSIFILGAISSKKFNNFYIFGIFYYFLMPNNYEVTLFIVSEVPYLFFTSLYLYNLFKNNLRSSFIFSILSFLIRSIGLVNIIIFFVFVLKKQKNKLINYIFAFLTICLFLSTYNLFVNDQFVISTTISTNIQGDSLYKNKSFIEFASSSFNLETLNFAKENLSRLYGDGSRDCSFRECFFYNPLFTKNGFPPDLLNSNSLFGKFLSPFLIQLFKLTSPLGFYTYAPVLFLFLFKRRDLFNNSIITIYFLNILLSILTVEYGARWWLLPNLLSIYLFSNLVFNVTTMIKKILR
tara:strand:+ start:652 stop:2007 length:1356 start_codon:yes stop_codon:yes gene_type:complete